MYKLKLDSVSNRVSSVFRTNSDGTISSIPFDPANTDFANFKKEILADEAQLQDAEGVIMADAKAYVASLP
jgi:hypothetical protein